MSLIDMIEGWIDFLESIWNLIKRIVVQILSFARHILKFFKNPDRLRQIKEDSNKLAIAIKENLDKGEYRVVNCLFDKAEKKVVDLDNEALGIEAEELDQQTEKIFGKREMVILQ